MSRRVNGVGSALVADRKRFRGQVRVETNVDGLGLKHHRGVRLSPAESVAVTVSLRCDGYS